MTALEYPQHYSHTEHVHSWAQTQTHSKQITSAVHFPMLQLKTEFQIVVALRKFHTQIPKMIVHLSPWGCFMEFFFLIGRTGGIGGSPFLAASGVSDFSPPGGILETRLTAGLLGGGPGERLVRGFGESGDAPPPNTLCLF